MKAKSILLFFFVCVHYLSGAQTIPPIQWQKCLGGTGFDYGNDCLQTSDGGYMIIGSGSSNDGDITGNNGGSDIWIVKLNLLGTIEWQKTYGGSGNEWKAKISKTPDAGYIFICTSNSVDADVTGNHGMRDIWVVKIDAIGTMQWQKSLGGSNDEDNGSIKTTADGGYILAGYTLSNNGDVTGNHGNGDAWIVKLASTGTVIWTKCYGGAEYDEASDVIETNDGNFVFAGHTYSNNGDLSINYGNADAWFAKVNSLNGTLMWSQTYGGSGYDIMHSLQETSDPVISIVASGSTSSQNDYNVTGNHGSLDVWVVTLDDGSGVLNSAKCFGGSGEDGWTGSSIQVTNDQGYFITTSSNKADGDVTSNQGNLDVWMLKLNRGQTIDWQLSAGGSSQDEAVAGIENTDGSYLICGITYSDNGNVSGNHGPTGYPDYWVVKLSSCFQPPVSSATISASGPACGGNVTLGMPGGPAYYYQWYKNAQEIAGATSRVYIATTPGTYTSVVVSAFCYSTFSPNSIVSQKPVATVSPSGTVNKCAADNVNFTANTGAALTYQWYRNNVAIAGAVNSTYTTKKAGKYKVTVYNSSTQCSKTTAVTRVNNTCKESIAFASDENSIASLPAALLEQNTPNPFNSSTVIQYRLPNKFTNARITVADVTGSIIKQFTLTHAGKGSVNIDAASIAQGTYIYSLYVDDRFVSSKRMVVIK